MNNFLQEFIPKTKFSHIFRKKTRKNRHIINSRKKEGKKNAKMHIHNNDALSFITRISAIYKFNLVFFF
jgi:hypothetical protein